MKKATYQSNWDDNVIVSTQCEVDTDKRMITDVESVNIDGVDSLNNEIVIIDDIEYNVLDADGFKDLWLEQEVNDLDSYDKEQYLSQMEDCWEFKDLFKVIGLWSKKSLDIRLNDFLVRNNSYLLINDI